MKSRENLIFFYLKIRKFFKPFNKILVSYIFILELCTDHDFKY